jgi:hypothetical protein
MDSESLPFSQWHRSHLKLWESLCRQHRIAEDSVRDSVPLFECNSGNVVLTKEIGIGRRRKVLHRSSLMEAAIDDHAAVGGLYDGLIYMMHTLWQ